MSRAVSAIAVCLLTLSGVACAAGTPQDELEESEAGLALWPIVTTSEEARLQIADGVREYDAQREDVAYEHFKRAIAADPASPSAQLWAAQTALSTTDYFTHIARASELAGTAGEAEQLVIAIVDQMNRNDNETARVTAAKLVALTPDNPRSWIMLARTDSFLSRTAEFRTSMHKAIEIAPEFTPAWIRLSQSYALSEPADFAKAEEYARKAMTLSPDEPVVHNILGDALRAQGKLEEAAQSYTKEAELDAANGAGLQQRGHVNTFLGRFAEARADYEAAVALSEGAVRTSFLSYQAFVSLHEGKPADALAELEAVYQGIEIGRDEAALDMKAAVAFEQALVAFHNRMQPELERAAQRAIEHNRALSATVATPEYARAVSANEALMSGLVALRRNDFTAARRGAAEYMRIREPDRSSNRNQPAHALLGYTALEEKKYDEAVRELEQTDVDNMLSAYYRGLALEGLGRTVEAQQVFQRVASFYFNPIDLAIVRRDALAKVRKAAP